MSRYVSGWVWNDLRDADADAMRDAAVSQRRNVLLPGRLSRELWSDVRNAHADADSHSGMSR